MVLPTAAETSDSVARGLEAVAQSNALVDKGDYSAAERVLRASYTSLKGPHADSVIAGLLAGELGFVNRALGRPLQADQMYRRSVSVLAMRLGNADPAVLRARCRIVAFYLEDGAIGQAERILRAELRPHLPDIHPTSFLAVDILQNEAALHYRKHRLIEARQAYEDILTRLGNEPEEQQRRAVILNNIGNVLLEAQRPELAIEYMGKAARVLETLGGPAHPEVGTILLNIAECHTRLQEYTEAEKALQRAVSIFTNSFGENHRYVGFALRRYSTVLAFMKRKQESRRMRKRGEEIMSAALGTERSRHLIDIEDLLSRNIPEVSTNRSRSPGR